MNKSRRSYIVKFLNRIYSVACDTGSCMPPLGSRHSPPIPLLMATCREKWTWTKILFIVGFILTAFIAAASVLYFISETGTIEVAACDDGLECTSGVQYADGTCSLRRKSAATKCSQCYTSKTGHCDPASGECVGGNPQDCIGWCDSNNDFYCANLWPMNAAYLEDSGWVYGTWCFANECTAYASFIVYTEPYFSGDGISGATCTELLDPVFFAANKSCITTERYVLPYFSVEVTNDWHTCIYRWTCAQSNQTFLNAHYGISSASERLAQSLGLASASDLPSEAIARLEARNARIQQIRDDHANLFPSSTAQKKKKR